MDDVIVLQFLQNKLNLEVSNIRQDHGFESERVNPTAFVSLAFDELLALQELINDKLKGPIPKMELPSIA